MLGKVLGKFIITLGKLALMAGLALYEYDPRAAIGGVAFLVAYFLYGPVVGGAVAVAAGLYFALPVAKTHIDALDDPDAAAD